MLQENINHQKWTYLHYISAITMSEQFLELLTDSSKVKQSHAVYLKYKHAFQCNIMAKGFRFIYLAFGFN